MKKTFLVGAALVTITGVGIGSIAVAVTDASAAPAPQASKRSSVTAIANKEHLSPAQVKKVLQDYRGGTAK